MSVQEGLESGEPGTDDGRFYFHLGDALQRVRDDSVSDTPGHTRVTAARSFHLHYRQEPLDGSVENSTVTSSTLQTGTIPMKLFHWTKTQTDLRTPAPHRPIGCRFTRDETSPQRIVVLLFLTFYLIVAAYFIIGGHCQSTLRILFVKNLSNSFHTICSTSKCLLTCS